MPPAYDLLESLGRQAGNHVWQSTAFAAVAVLLALTLKANHARIRYWLWLAASLKFLVPFSLLAMLGSCLGSWFRPPSAPPRLLPMVTQVLQPFAPTEPALPAGGTAPVESAASLAPALVAAIWFCGCMVVLLRWWIGWRQVRAAVLASAPLEEGREVEALRRLGRRIAFGSELRLVSSAARLEPGIFGILRPVLWLPARIGSRLSDAELEAILAHEVCHARRRDNLTAALHMAVEAVFWFHPLVWWLGARLSEERERACDEEVIRVGHDPQAYADAVLKVCELYLASPLACAAGVTGADLKRRIEGIMRRHFVHELSFPKKTLLAVLAVLALAGPLAVGLVNPSRGRAQSRSGDAPGSKSDLDRPTFDVADVHVTSARVDRPIDGPHRMQGGFLNADRYELRNATMLDLIRTAYSADADKVAGGPNWLDYDRYDIIAKTKPGTRPERLRLMLQTLLADRFHLKVKTETRPVPGYVLSKGKRELKLTAAGGGANSGGCRVQDRAFDGETAYSTIRCRKVTMDTFAQALGQLGSGPLRKLPVADSTGLGGAWDFDFRYAQRMASLDSRTDAGVLEALDKLGLKLELGTVPQRVLTVEGVNRRPSPNSPDVAVALPPLPPPEFEVAAIRPCKGNDATSPRFEAGGRLTATCTSLNYLIHLAWNVPVFGELPGLPNWANGRKINIEAKAPAGVAVDPQHSDEAKDLLDRMLRSLLIERYKMKVHYEDRPVDAPTLVAVNPKLSKADPANRTGCSRQQQLMRDRALVRLVCRNMTMAQFAEQIPAYDLTLIYPVLDGTGIDGGWDFTIDYDWLASVRARFPQPSGAQPGGAAAAASGARGEVPAASDPSGTLSFAEAIEKQAGLKLKFEKRPVPVLVIDHIEEKPTEN